MAATRARDTTHRKRPPISCPIRWWHRATRWNSRGSMRCACAVASSTTHRRGSRRTGSRSARFRYARRTGSSPTFSPYSSSVRMLACAWGLLEMGMLRIICVMCATKMREGRIGAHRCAKDDCQNVMLLRPCSSCRRVFNIHCAPVCSTIRRRRGCLIALV